MVIPGPIVTLSGSNGFSVIAISVSVSDNKPCVLSCASMLFKLSSSESLLFIVNCMSIV